MKIKNLFGALAVVLSLTALREKPVQLIEASDQPDALAALPAFPDICIPGVPDKGDCCLWEIQRRVDGKREAKLGSAYQCDMGQHRRGDMNIKMTLKFPGGPCDQQDIPANNSTLEAKGDLIWRADKYAYFSGEFVIKDSSGNELFKGRIETTDRLGSHQLFFNCERCNPQSHFEGWLVGRGTSAFPNHTLRALIVARGTAPSPGALSTPITGSITGTLIKCP